MMKPRDGAAGAEITGLIDLSSWPPGMWLIIRRERPHSGSQLRFTDHDGNRLTAFATNTRKGQLAELELRHRHRARCEDRIRNAKDTGLRNLPFRGFDANRIWLAIVARARPDRLAAKTRSTRPPRPPLGTENPTPAPIPNTRTDRSPRPQGPPATIPHRPGHQPRAHRPRPATRHLTSGKPAPTTTERTIRARGTQQPTRCTGHPLTPFYSQNGRTRAIQPNQASTSPT